MDNYSFLQVYARNVMFYKMPEIT